MRIEDYPEQEPFSELGEAYHTEVMTRGAEIEGIEISYGSDPYQRVAFYVPDKPNGTVLAFMHGGGWTNGYKEWMAFMAPALNARGILFASIGYRPAPAHVSPTGIQDAALGLAAVHANAADHGGDPERLFVGGHSAGGHYAALLAVTDRWQEGCGVPANVVRGCLPVSGVFDFTRGSGLSQRPRFLGAEGNEKPASPLHRVAPKPPPFLIAHGDDDFPHLMRQASAMRAELIEMGGSVETIVMPGCDHLGASYACGDPRGPWLTPAAMWMTAH